MGALQDVPKGDVQFPLNLNADSTTYIFTQTNRIDTLTVYYKKRIYTASNTCGYVLDLEAPTSGKTHTTTFKQIEVEYRSYYTPLRGTKSYYPEEESGIIVKINEL
ncbi:hypothetical protein DTQ70_28450 [Runella sp. SP2]|nr:hypothetical protein DTQ70_28450 [Runella sp. SP2]